ncbi:3'(2'),5'-bisphosphate nucleotidase CysQ [Helicobacter sp. MIT 99-5507]|uniref:3'(2'),5'-bisphosphate nucleotidase CysQ family protein n=1 Tax=Helicobacter sp. MIT 99-5507 TaxID=152489 RepID=UPI000E1E7834|nr:3'(2'),5'-bisphosphate nucleotidase CysQ [Helicobacter sp. MIT 99-5507]RDU58252.1 3'(2'),5'-bisphosphate nucleotidase CysQ [Helicobacter sp. MIT 99-5507]
MKDLLNNVINIAFRAGEIVLKYYGDTSFIKKDDDSPLTKADIESNRIITHNLQAISSFKINSEEDILDYSKRKNEEYLWLIDPLDGTKDFISKNNEWTINIALLKHNIPILGVVYAPALKKMYFALEKNGAYVLEDSNIIDNAIRIYSQKDTTAIIALDSRFHSTKNVDNFIKKYKLIKQTLGSSLKICSIAEGKADIYPRFNGTKEWDIAASDIILRESGGIILDFNTKKQLLYNKQDVKNNYFIAFSKSQINKEIYNDFMEDKIILERL